MHPANPVLIKPSAIEAEPAFCMTYSSGFPGWLAGTGGCLALTTYQAGKLILICAEAERIVQLPRTFAGATGLAVRPSGIAVASGSEVVLLAEARRLAAGYPRRASTYDALYLPMRRQLVGTVAVHDLAWAANGSLLAVNTACSCIIALDDGFHGRPIWQPRFVSSTAPEDRCHLNGLTVDAEGRPAYVTAFAACDTPMGWRDAPEGRGVLIHVPSGEIVLDDLSMPHSPRMHRGRVYLLNSAAGELLCFDPESATSRTIARLPGFARGLALVGDCAVIGVSRRRPDRPPGPHETLPTNDDASVCGVFVVRTSDGALMAELRYARDCSEIYEVAFVAGVRRPNVLAPDDPLLAHALHLPDWSGWSPAAG